VQNRAGEVRAVKPLVDALGKLGIRAVFENLSILGLSVLYFFSFVFNLNIFSAPWWYFLLTSACFYASFRIILGSDKYQKFFLILIPILVGSIWQFGYVIRMDFSPFLLMAVPVMFFCFNFMQAITGIILLLGIASAPYLDMRDFESITIWLPVFSLIWGSIFWFLQREGERFRFRAVTIESRARGLMSSEMVSESAGEEMPDLDEETQIAKAVANVFRIDNLIEWILSAVFEVMHPHSCFFFFMDREDGILKVMKHKSRSKFFNPNATVELDSKDLFTWVIQNRKQLRHERLPRTKQYPGYYTGRERILSCLLFPVIKNGEIEGVLGVDSRRSYSFGNEQERLLGLFSNLIADVVEAFRIFQQKESHAEYMEAFYSSIKKILETKLDPEHRLDLLIQIAEMGKKCDEFLVAIPGDTDRLIIRKEKGTFFEKLHGAPIQATSIVGDLITKTNDVVILEGNALSDRSNGIFTPVEPNIKINSLMVVPLPMEDRAIGLLVLGSRRRAYFAHNDRYFFSSLAAQFGFALENAINARRIEQLAITDGLTGINNHRYFQDTLSREIKRAERTPTPFSLLMMDIDYFKRFNDTYGHQAGDEVLKGVAGLLKDQARDIDYVARYGGEEFVLLLLNCEAKAANRTADRIRKLCAKRKFDLGKQIVSVTLSIGVANYPAHATQAAKLISAADKALYRAKDSGRNQVCMAVVEDDA